MELTLCERLEPEVQLYLATLQPASRSVTIEETNKSVVAMNKSNKVESKAKIF